MIRYSKIVFIAILLSCSVDNTCNYSSRERNLKEILSSLKNPEGRVIISAHRGDWRNAPENSLRAIQNCIDMGIDIVEIDVRKTKDNHLVLMHDKTLDRTTTGSGYVDDWTLDSLKSLNLKNGLSIATSHTIPTLEEALNTAEGRILLYLDKTMEYMPETMALLNDKDMLNNVIFMHPITFTEAQEIFRDKLDKVNLVARIDTAVVDPNTFIEEYIKSGFKPIAFQLRFTEGQEEIIPTILKNDIRVCVSTLWPKYSADHDDDKAIDDPESHWGWHLEKGVSIFNTDRPLQLRNYLISKKR